MLPWVSAAATARQAPTRCRRHGSHRHTPCARFVDITPPHSSDRHSSTPAAAPCYKRTLCCACVRRRTSGLYTFRWSATRARLAAATAGALHTRGCSAATDQPSGFARHQPLRTLLSVGPTCLPTGLKRRAKRGWSSAVIPVSQHCEGLGVQWPASAAATARHAYRCHGPLPAQDVSPRATCSIVPRCARSRCHRRRK